MKIEAAQRLTALKIVSQDDAYPEEDGRFNLRTFNKFTHKLVKTNIPDFNIAVSRDLTREFFIETFLLHGERAVGTVAITKSYLNEKKGKIYAPSSYFSPKYRGLGYAKALYRWILNSGTNLVTKSTQSKFSNALWHSLSKEFQMIEVLNGAIVENKEYGTGTRLVLLGKGNTKDELIREFKLADYTVYG